MKGKRFLARRELLIVGGILGPLGYAGFFVCATFFSYDQPDLLTIWIYFGMLVFCTMGLFIPCAYVCSSGTITLYEDRFCYKKRLFAKKKWMKYDDITQLYIDFCNYPVGISGQRVPKSIYINSATATECQVNITYKLIAEFRKHIDKKRIHVNFESLLSFRKKFREQLGDCLTMWQKIELKQKLGNKKKKR